jgi:hypothetical protein
MNNELNDILNQEIARELLLEKDPELSDTTFDFIWSASSGKPWDCPVLYDIFKLAGKI